MSADIEQKDQLFLHHFLRDSGLGGGIDHIEMLHGDGSDRRFYRIVGTLGMVAVFPSLTHPQGAGEARATYLIGYHLHDLGVAVPKVLGHHRQEGMVLFEDVGDEHLQARALSCRSEQERGQLYFKAVDALLTFQIDGVVGFDTRSCYDTPKFDYELMVQRESDYFLHALCRDYVGRDFDTVAVKKECMAIARRASLAPVDFLLHRDYQSRNLMVMDQAIRIIDFQGARLGPLGYDLASLLFDPYVGLLPHERETIFEYYVKEASLRVTLDRDHFRESYGFLAVQRVLQMLGAFGFLTMHRGKAFFEPFILPSLDNLRGLMAQLPDDYPFLLELIVAVQEDIQECRHFSSP